jgi:hypothetical protein
LGNGCLSIVSVVCCQVEVSASGWSLVQRSHTECSVSECDQESSTMRMPLGLLLHDLKKNMSTSDHRAPVAGRWIRMSRPWPKPYSSRVSFWSDCEKPLRPAVIRTVLWAEIWTERTLSKRPDRHHFRNLLAFRIMTCSSWTTGINCT